jgi:hypothetical protein
MASWAHLAGRFVRAHRPGRLSGPDRDFVTAALTPPELALWERLPRHDHHHTVEVARRVETALAGTEHGGDSRWLAAALLHDVGKLESGFGIYGRVMATLAGKAWRDRAGGWRQGTGLARRVGDYLCHDVIGGEMIRAAGGRVEPAHWADAHHGRVPVDAGVVPLAVAAVLAAADPD